MINKFFYEGHYIVIFKDELDITYYYGITKEGKQIKQFCEKDEISSEKVTETNEEETLHNEEKCVKSN